MVRLCIFWKKYTQIKKIKEIKPNSKTVTTFPIFFCVVGKILLATLSQVRIIGIVKRHGAAGERAMNKLIKLAAKSGNLTLAVWQALRANVENNEDVYLDNARQSLRDAGVELTEHQFAGHLAALEKRGAYSRIDGFFGTVGRFE